MIFTRHFWIVFISVCATLMCTMGCVQAQQTGVQFSVTTLQAGIHLIKAEVAATASQRSQGLMFRETLGPNQGMVFLFERSGIHCMWMKNTLIPLSVAFLDDKGTIINIADMQAHDETNHCATKPALYALEMNLNWFTKHGIKPGSRIDGITK